MHRRLFLKSVICIIFLLLLQNSVQSQIGLARHGVKFYQELDVRQADDNSCAPLANDRLAFAWSQADFDGIRRIHLQIISADQQLAFPDEPPALSRNQHADNPVLCSALDGGAYVAWFELLGDEVWRIRLQKIRSNGSCEWQRGGIEVAEVSSYRLPKLHVYCSSEGSCFVEFSESDYLSRRVLAFTSGGNPRDGWPREGIPVECDYGDIIPVKPDPWGGFWLVIESDAFNRVRADGSLVWRQPVEFESPENVSDNNPELIYPGSDYLFCIWDVFSKHEAIVAVYDSSGYCVAEDILASGCPDASGRWYSCKVTADDRLVFFYNYYVVEYEPGDYWEEPINNSCGVLYAPFEENRFPWGREDSLLVEDLEFYSLGVPIYEVGNNYLVKNGSTIYPFNRNGQQLWDDEPYILPWLDGSSRGGTIYPCEDFAWLHGGEDRIDYAYKFNSTGERTGEEPLRHLIPGLRDMQEYLLFPASDGGLDVVWEDKWRGMVGQKIDDHGRPGASLAGVVRDSLWDESNYGGPFSGTIGDNHWHWWWLGAFTAWLNVFDSDGNTITSRQIDINPEGLGRGYHIENPVDNGTDQILVSFYASDLDAKLFAFNTNGELIAEGGLPEDRNSGFNGFIQCWPDQGWLILNSDEDNIWHTHLFDENLELVWSDIAIGNLNRMEAGFIIDNVVFYDTVAVIYDLRDGGTFPLKRFKQGVSSTVLATDTLHFFQDGMRGNAISLQPASDGGWWLMVLNGSSHILQSLSPNGRMMLGGSGMLMAEDLISNERTKVGLHPDTEGGTWIVRAEQGSVRATHLNSNGRPQSELYAEEGGVDVFENSNMRYLSSVIDPGTGCVWVMGMRETRIDNRLVSYDYRIQLLGDDFLGITSENHNTVEEFELYPCFPSPFNNFTTVTFSLAEKSEVILKVFDINGRLVRNLSPSGMLNAGKHSVSWDAGKHATGLYFVGLECGGKSKVQRVVLLR